MWIYDGAVLCGVSNAFLQWAGNVLVRGASLSVDLVYCNLYICLVYMTARFYLQLNEAGVAGNVLLSETAHNICLSATVWQVCRAKIILIKFLWRQNQVLRPLIRGDSHYLVNFGLHFL